MQEIPVITKQLPTEEIQMYWNGTPNVDFSRYGEYALQKTYGLKTYVFEEIDISSISFSTISNKLEENIKKTTSPLKQYAITVRTANGPVFCIIMNEPSISKSVSAYVQSVLKRKFKDELIGDPLTFPLHYLVLKIMKVIYFFIEMIVCILLEE